MDVSFQKLITGITTNEEMYEKEHSAFVAEVKNNNKTYIEIFISELTVKTENFLENLKSKKESPSQFFLMLKLLKDCIDAAPIFIGTALEENEKILKNLGEIAKFKSLNSAGNGSADEEELYLRLILEFFYHWQKKFRNLESTPTVFGQVYSMLLNNGVTFPSSETFRFYQESKKKKKQSSPKQEKLKTNENHTPKELKDLQDEFRNCIQDLKLSIKSQPENSIEKVLKNDIINLEKINSGYLKLLENLNEPQDKIVEMIIIDCQNIEYLNTLLKSFSSQKYDQFCSKFKDFLQKIEDEDNSKVGFFQIKELNEQANFNEAFKKADSQTFQQQNIGGNPVVENPFEFGSNFNNFNNNKFEFEVNNNENKGLKKENVGNVEAPFEFGPNFTNFNNNKFGFEVNNNENKGLKKDSFEFGPNETNFNNNNFEFEVNNNENKGFKKDSFEFGPIKVEFCQFCPNFTNFNNNKFEFEVNNNENKGLKKDSFEIGPNETNFNNNNFEFEVNNNENKGLQKDPFEFDFNNNKFEFEINNNQNKGLKNEKEGNVEELTHVDQKNFGNSASVMNKEEENILKLWLNEMKRKDEMWLDKLTEFEKSLNEKDRIWQNALEEKNKMWLEELNKKEQFYENKIGEKEKYYEGKIACLTKEKEILIEEKAMLKMECMALKAEKKQ